MSQNQEKCPNDNCRRGYDYATYHQCVYCLGTGIKPTQPSGRSLMPKQLFEDAVDGFTSYWDGKESQMGGEYDLLHKLLSPFIRVEGYPYFEDIKPNLDESPSGPISTEGCNK